MSEHLEKGTEMYDMFKNEIHFLSSVGYGALCLLAIEEARTEGRISEIESAELVTITKSNWKRF